MCVAGGVITVTPKKLLPVAWHVAQPEVMPVWFIVAPVHTPGVVWHSVHVWLVGTWFAGIAVMPAANDVVELWQAAQSPLSGCAGSFAGVGRVTIVTPNHVLPVSWQVAHGVPATGPCCMPVPPKLPNADGE